MLNEIQLIFKSNSQVDRIMYIDKAATFFDREHDVPQMWQPKSVQILFVFNLKRIHMV